MTVSFRSLANSLRSFVGVLKAFPRWWAKEIASLLPGYAAESKNLFAQSGPTGFCFSRGTIPNSKTEQLYRSGEPVIYRFKLGEVLHRTVNLPISARAQLNRILSHELQRQSPISLSNILFNYQIVKTDRSVGRMDVVIVMVKRRSIETIASNLLQLGLHLTDLRVPLVDDNRELPIRVKRKIGLSRDITSWLVVSMLSTSLAFLIISPVIGIWKQDLIISALSAQFADLHHQAFAVRGLEKELIADQSLEAYLTQQKQKLLFGQIVAEATRLLPDGTWLSALDFDGQQIRIQGYSSNPSDLAAVFDSSPIFGNATFLSPMTQSPEPGIEQFDLSVSTSEN